MDFNVVLGAIFSAAFVASVLRISAPLILPALGGLLSDLAGCNQYCPGRHHAGGGFHRSGRQRLYP